MFRPKIKINVNKIAAQLIDLLEAGNLNLPDILQNARHTYIEGMNAFRDSETIPLAGEPIEYYGRRNRIKKSDKRLAVFKSTTDEKQAVLHFLDGPGDNDSAHTLKWAFIKEMLNEIYMATNVQHDVKSQVGKLRRAEDSYIIKKIINEVTNRLKVKYSDINDTAHAFKEETQGTGDWLRQGFFNYIGAGLTNPTSTNSIDAPYKSGGVLEL